MCEEAPNARGLTRWAGKIRGRAAIDSRFTGLKRPKEK